MLFYGSWYNDLGASSMIVCAESSFVGPRYTAWTKKCNSGTTLIELSIDYYGACLCNCIDPESLVRDFLGILRVDSEHWDLVKASLSLEVKLKADAFTLYDVNATARCKLHKILSGVFECN